jgi:hypothetical protein
MRNIDWGRNDLQIGAAHTAVGGTAPQPSKVSVTSAHIHRRSRILAPLGPTARRQSNASGVGAPRAALAELGVGPRRNSLPTGRGSAPDPRENNSQLGRARSDQEGSVYRRLTQSIRRRRERIFPTQRRLCIRSDRADGREVRDVVSERRRPVPTAPAHCWSVSHAVTRRRASRRLVACIACCRSPLSA